MKKILLIALIGTLFAATGAFACDTCAKHTKAADGAKMVCPADCGKACSAEKMASCEGCESKCCADKKACCGECGGDKTACTASCDKPCCAKKKAETATKSEGMAPCCSSMLGKPA